MVAEFEADLIRMRTREGMAVAKAKGRLKGKQPKLSKTQRKHLLTLHDAGEHTQANWRSCFGFPGRPCTASSNERTPGVWLHGQRIDYRVGRVPARRRN